MSADVSLTKVYVDLPNHWAVGGESLWARPLGDDRYQLHNVPFYAYGLNYLDVVEARADEPERKPEVQRVLSRSGHETFRVRLPASLPDDERAALVTALQSAGASLEWASPTYVAVDVAPEADYDGVRVVLDEWEEQDGVEYETCEERVDGRFDDAPDSME